MDEMKRLTFFFALILTLSVLSAQAAQIAVVRAENASLYKGPQSDSPVIDHLKAGVRLIAGSYPVGDSYKVKTAEGEIGWMKAADLGLEGFKPIPVPSPSAVMTPSG